MTLRLPTILSFSIVALALCLPTYAAPKTNVKASLKAAYASRDVAFVKKDVKGALAPYNAEAVFISADGEQSTGIAEQRQDLSKLFASDTSFSSANTEITELVANTRGNEATTRAVRHIVLVAKSVTDQTSPVIVDETVRDHWVKGKFGWHVTQERRLTNSTLLELCQGSADAPASDKPVKNSIVGKWVGNLPSRPGMTAQMTIEFREDGTELQTIVAPRQDISIHATYTAKDNVLTQTLVSGMKNGQATPNEGQVQTLHYEIDGDTLSISLSGASDTIRLTKQPD